GLAFFYGGMVRSKSVLNIMMMCFGAIGLIGVLWVLYGYGLAYGDDVGWLFGWSNDLLGITGLLDFDPEADPTGGTVDVAFQAMFAIITVALIAGAIADRARFGPWLLFAGLWATLVYFPVAAWVWGGGWIQNLGGMLGFSAEVLDYAGGTAVHINAGAAAFALAIVLGKRVGFQRGIQKPHNVPLVILGASILWFGWFGFNAGAEFSNGLEGVGLIVLNT